MRTISNTFLKALLTGAVQQGYDPRFILSEADVPYVMYETPGAYIDGLQINRVSRKAVDIIQDICLGFFRKFQNEETLWPLFSKLYAQCHSLGELIQEGVTLFQLMRDDIEIHTTIHGQWYIYTWCNRESLVADTRAYDFNTMLYLIRHRNWVVGKSLKLKVVGFMGAPLCPNFDYEAVFGCEVKFHQHCYYYSFHRDQLALPPIRSIEEMNNYRNYLPADVFILFQEEPYYARAVEKHLRSVPADGSALPTFENIANALGLSVRSLHRKLAAENASYQGIKSQIRKEFAVNRLIASSSPIYRIASQLGFSEPAAFRRAFKSWTGLSPQQFREAHYCSA